MIRTLATALATSLIVAAPLAARAGGFDNTPDPVTIAPAPAIAPASPDLIFRLGAGVSYGSSYFGSTDNEAGATGSFSFQFLRGPGGRTLGSETGAPQYGFAPRGSFRVISKRSATDHAELTGLPDVPLSVEIGFGLGYTSQNFEAFADVRYGAIGHHAFVGELGADVVLRPSDRLTLTAGPRVIVGSEKFNQTYFGIAAPTATFGAYDASSGAVSAGLEVGASYALNDKWNLDGTVRYDRFVGTAKTSPIVTQGSDDNFRVTIGLSRLISLDF